MSVKKFVYSQYITIKKIKKAYFDNKTEDFVYMSKKQNKNGLYHLDAEAVVSATVGVQRCTGGLKLRLKVT